MQPIKFRNLILVTSFILPILMGVSAFSSGKDVSQMSNTDISSAGFGIMGDSTTDEYQADDHRGGDYADTTLGWVEQLVKQRHLNFGAWDTRDEPRRTGFEYNWARSGATAESLISEGQHTGLAKQVAEGKVSYVFLWIGTNDFHPINGSYREIYDGSLSDEQLQKKADSIVANITLAVDTILAAGPVKMVVVNIRDIGSIPQAQELFPDAAGRERATKVVQSINQRLDEMAAKRHVKIVPADDFTRSLLARTDKTGYLHIGNELIKALGVGNEPHNLRLEDSDGHLGTVASGIIANTLFIAPFNSAYDTKIAPLTDAEILQDAGIKTSVSSIVKSVIRNSSRSPILIGIGSMFIILLGVVVFRLRRR